VGKESHRVRFPVYFSGGVCALESNDGVAPAVQGVEEVEDGDRIVAARSMARRSTRRCPGLAGNRRWSFAEARACSVCIEFDDLMHGSAEKPVREMRQIKEKRIGEGGGVRAHWRGGIWTNELADAAVSDERLRRFCGVSCRRTKGRWGRRPRAT
jgi:hypothetical protein